MESETLEEKGAKQEKEEATEMPKRKGKEKEEIKEEEKKTTKKGKDTSRSSRKRGREKGQGSKKQEGGEKKKPKKAGGSKAAQEPVTPPHESRPVRERKSVERFTVSSEKAPSASSVVSIQKVITVLQWVFLDFLFCRFSWVF